MQRAAEIAVDEHVHDELAARFRRDDLLADIQRFVVRNDGLARRRLLNDLCARAVGYVRGKRLAVNDDVDVPLAALILAVFAHIREDVQRRIRIVRHLKVDMARVHRRVQPLIHIGRGDGVRAALEADIGVAFEQRVIERGADLAHAAAVLLAETVAAEDTVRFLPAVLLVAVAHRVVEAPGAPRLDDGIVDGGNRLFNVERAVRDELVALLVGVLARALKIVYRGERADLRGALREIVNGDGRFDRRQRGRDRRLILTRGKRLLDQRGCCSNVQPDARLALRIDELRFAAARKINGKRRVRWRGGKRRVDLVDALRQSALVDGDRRVIHLLRAA